MPYGLIAADSITDSSGGVLAPSSSVFRNRIINGDMRIDQRNAGASTTFNDGYTTIDRFAGVNSQTSKLTAQQNQGSVTPPAGFSNYLGLTSSSAYSVLTGDFFAVTQRIEGFNCADLAWGTASASAVTLSFWVRSSLTGTFGGSLRNSAGNRSYPFTYTITAANTWEKETITIAGDTSGTWNKTNGIGIEIDLGLGVGTTYSGTAGAWAAGNFISATGATSVVGTNGATFYITGVQLEKGSTATSFDYRNYQAELAMCQRYLPAFFASGSSQYFAAGTNAGTNNFILIPFLVTTRVAPTGIVSSAANTFAVYNGVSNPTASAIAFNAGTTNAGQINLTTTALTAGTASQGYWTGTTGYLYFTGCEL
jgi:hypothetical protein